MAEGRVRKTGTVKKKKEYSQNTLRQTWKITSAIKAYMDGHNLPQKQLGDQSSVSKNLGCVIREEIKNPDGSVKYVYQHVSASHRMLSLPMACEYCEKMGTDLYTVMREYAASDPDECGSSNPTNSHFEKNYGTHDEHHASKAGVMPNDAFSASKHAGAAGTVDDLITDVSRPEFKKWFGTYHTCFSATNSTQRDEGRYFDGTLVISDQSEDGLCHVDFRFCSEPAIPKTKYYKGTLTLAKQVVYITLADPDDEKEISYLILRNPDLKTTVPFSLGIALVLTLSSNVSERNPCCERMLISRFPIPRDGEAAKFVQSQLYTNGKELLVSESKYKQFLESITDESDIALRTFKADYPDFGSFPSNEIRPERYIKIPESWFDLQLDLEEVDVWKIHFLMRAYAVNNKYIKVNSASENTLYHYLRDLSKETTAPAEDGAASAPQA